MPLSTGSPVTGMSSTVKSSLAGTCSKTSSGSAYSCRGVKGLQNDLVAEFHVEDAFAGCIAFEGGEHEFHGVGGWRGILAWTGISSLVRPRRPLEKIHGVS